MSSAVPISRAAVVRELDRRLIEEIGLPSAVVMEHAGHLVADRIVARFPDARRIGVLCGPGNNGGDGYVVARQLAVRGFDAFAVAIYDPRSPDAVVHGRACERLGLVAALRPGTWERMQPGAGGAPDVVVDALFGTGQRALLTLPTLPPLDGIPVVSVDVPTGIDADTGTRVGEFPRPDFVVAIGRHKPFLFVAPIPWAFCDIGLEQAAARVVGRLDVSPEAVLVTSVDRRPFRPSDQKWSRGHVGIVAGSEELAGAAVLAAQGALGGAAGLVTLYIPKAAWGRLAGLPPEVMVRERGDYNGCDALVVGPGLGRAADVEVRRIWRDLPIPCVFDADGLRALNGAPSQYPRLITPHAGEASHLLGPDRRELESDRLATARRLRAIAPAIYKGACPIVTGDPLQVLEGGLPQLGTGGSGDVLAGLCGALLARERPRDAAGIERAAVVAAWMHLRAGELAGPPGITARDVAAALPRV